MGGEEKKKFHIICFATSFCTTLFLVSLLLSLHHLWNTKEYSVNLVELHTQSSSVRSFIVCLLMTIFAVLMDKIQGEDKVQKFSFSLRAHLYCHSLNNNRKRTRKHTAPSTYQKMFLFKHNFLVIYWFMVHCTVYIVFDMAEIEQHCWAPEWKYPLRMHVYNNIKSVLNSVHASILSLRKVIKMVMEWRRCNGTRRCSLLYCQVFDIQVKLCRFFCVEKDIHRETHSHIDCEYALIYERKTKRGSAWDDNIATLTVETI